MTPEADPAPVAQPAAPPGAQEAIAPRHGPGHGRRAHRASRAHLHGAVRPSPARAEPHDSATWLPLPDVDVLPVLDGAITTAPDGADTRSAAPDADAPAAAPPSPARARPHDATAWFPLPVPDELPSIDEMLTQAPWEAKPSPGRAEPHEPDAWLPLPEPTSLPAVPALTGDPVPAAPAAVPATAGPTPAPLPVALPEEPVPVVGTARRPRRLRTVLVALLALGTLAAGGVVLTRLADSGTSVEVRVDGRRVSLDTDVATVGQLLRDQGVRLGEFDRVVPGPRAALRDGLTITVLRAFPISRDLDGERQTVFTTYASPSDYVRKELGPDTRLVIRSAPQRLQAESTIILRTPHSGRLVVDSAQVDYDIPALDVDELLAQYSVELGPEDYVHDRSGAVVDRDTHLVDGEEYSVVRIGREIVRVDEAYTLPDERHPDPDLPVGETRVEPGAAGIKSVSYEIVRRNGEEAERRVVSQVPVTEARPTVTFYGTKADPMWDRIAQCETGGNWGMQGPLYSGGLGFYNRTWDAFGGRDFAPNAGLASREEEIIVAERLRRSVGIGGWGCAHILGYVR